MSKEGAERGNQEDKRTEGGGEGIRSEAKRHTNNASV